MSATAQPNDIGDNNKPNAKREEKIKALYVAYITQELNLNSDEAQKFWPVHSQYDAELKAINKGKADELTRQQTILDIKKKYQPNFSKILGANRCDIFYKKDAEFRKKVVERLQQLKQNRQQNNGSPRFRQ